jgi:hypothetical protein
MNRLKRGIGEWPKLIGVLNRTAAQRDLVCLAPEGCRAKSARAAKRAHAQTTLWPVGKANGGKFGRSRNKLFRS